MRVWSLLCFFLTVTTSTANNIALFWNLYDAVISGGRILHDVADGVGAVSKAIRAIDSFLDSTAEAQVRITASLQLNKTLELFLFEITYLLLFFCIPSYKHCSDISRL